MHIVTTDRAPKAIGPYSQAVMSGGFLFCAGQIGIDPASGKLAGADVETQARQTLANIRNVLAAAGLGFGHVVKTTVFLASMEDFPVVNGIYAQEFGEHKPARSTVQVARLPLGARIEIECIAEVQGK